MKEQTRQVGEIVEGAPELEAPTGRNIIVAIGINDYRHQPSLNNPINDAQAMLALFKQCGFQELPRVPSLVADDATRSAIAALPEQLAMELTPDDNLLIFFAGHGEKKERQAPDPAQPGKTYTHRTGYLIPVDGPQNRPGEWIKLDAFLDSISGLPARHIFVILDACKSGIALSEKFKVRGGAQPAAVEALRKLPSRRVMTSARHDEKAAEGGSGSGHSVFAEALIAAIQDRQADKDGDGYIKTVDLFSFVQDRVSDRAKKLFKLKQTPDYGYLPGDGSGDLVISLREGAFNRLLGEALEAMLRHDVTLLETLVAQLIAANPTYPATLYLQFRLKFMQGDIPAAAQLVSHLRDLDLPAGTLPLSQTELTNLSIQLPYWGPLFALPAGNPPLKITMLARTGQGDYRSAPLMSCPAGEAFQIDNDVHAMFQVTNLSDRSAHLYYIAVVPHGRLVYRPMLDSYPLKPGDTKDSSPFLTQGLPGSVTETRIFWSAKKLSWMKTSPTLASMAIGSLTDDPTLDQMKMLVVHYHIPDSELPRPVDAQMIEKAFAY